MPHGAKYISHFPMRTSSGRTVGLWQRPLGKCLALRIATAMAKREGWMAEHMLILRLISPEGKQYHIAAAFPSACGKTNLAMIQPTIEGWKAECLGDDIAWMKIGPDGRLYAINPEAGFFGVAPGTSYSSNPMAMDTVRENTIFTNCALTDDGDIWWRMTTPPEHAIDWRARLTPAEKTRRHPNARFTAFGLPVPHHQPRLGKARGRPSISYLWAPRHPGTPRVEAYDWDHGVFLGPRRA